MSNSTESLEPLTLTSLATPLDTTPPARLSRRMARLAGLVGLLLTGTACSTIDLINAMADAPSGPSTTLSFGDHPRQRVDVYLPQQAGPNSRLPVMVFYYGGSWISGDRKDYRFVARALNDLGFIVAIPDYRLTPEVVYPDFLKDSANAVKAVRQAIPGLGGDANQLVLMGHSAGAYNAAMLAYDGRWLSPSDKAAIKGFVGLAGPYDFLPIGIPSVQQTFNWPNTPRDTQPIEHIQAGGPPALLMAARPDFLVSPVKNTQAMAQKMQETGVPVEVKLYNKVGHASLIASLVPPFSALASARSDIAEFLNRVTPLPGSN